MIHKNLFNKNRNVTEKAQLTMISNAWSSDDGCCVRVNHGLAHTSSLDQPDGAIHRQPNDHSQVSHSTTHSYDNGLHHREIVILVPAIVTVVVLSTYKYNRPYIVIMSVSELSLPSFAPWDVCHTMAWFHMISIAVIYGVNITYLALLLVATTYFVFHCMSGLFILGLFKLMGV